MGKETILVIEDNQFNRKLVRTLLQLGAYHVLEAADAESGLQLARERHPAMILMDIQLPGMDGLEATRAICSDADLMDIPVVALTAHAMKGDEEKAFDAGCVGYIAKPIDTRSFLDTINRLKHEKPNRAAGSQSGHRHRVLIVDDDPVNTKLISSMLPKDTYTVITAHSGETCLHKTQREHPDLILLDIMMPGVDGYEVTRRLKENSQTQHVPIMLIAAQDEKTDRIRGMEAGADDFLSKPVNAYELRARVQSLLRLKVYHEQLQTRSRSQDSVLEPALRDAVQEETIYSPRILVVDNDPEEAQCLQECLDDASFRLTVVDSGEAALESARNDTIDVMLLDIVLPDLNGFDVIEQIKKMPGHRNLQTVVVTRVDDPEEKIRSIRLGVDQYFVKPANREELSARVHALLKQKANLDRLSDQFENALQAAISDKLTGIYNHAYFKHFLDLEIKRSSRQKHPLALIMIDIDNFKQYNDAHGHPAGDALLKWIGGLLQTQIREVDVPARYGGEEFAVVLPYADREGAPHVAERIREAMRTEPLSGPGMKKTERITVSMGIAFYPDDADSAKELIRCADTALYQAKNEGKDRFCIYGENPPGGLPEEALPPAGHGFEAKTNPITQQTEATGL